MGLHLVVGVMGPGESASKKDEDIACRIGQCIAESGYTLLTGGRDCGVMHAALRGARSAGGLTIGVLPGDNTRHMSPFIDIPIITGMGIARNIINILSSRIVVSVGAGPGTLSEISFAVKAGKPLISYHLPPDTRTIIARLNPTDFSAPDLFEPEAFQKLLQEKISVT